MKEISIAYHKITFNFLHLIQKLANLQAPGNFEQLQLGQKMR